MALLIIVSCISIVACTALYAIWHRREQKRFDRGSKMLLSDASAEWADYQGWLNEQVCIGCGAAYKDKSPDTWWYTEQWCGCKAGRSKPDSRPARQFFGHHE